MDTLWSMTTTIREAERIPSFLRIAKKIEGQDWNPETQNIFQILLIKNREYLNQSNAQTFNRLNQHQINLLKDKSIAMTFEQAKDIFEAKKYQEPSMRGRQSMSPLVKLGLVDKSSGKILITDIGNKLVKNEITFDEFMLEQLLKLQYPNAIEKERLKWNSKPFVTALHLIKCVNQLCIKEHMKAKGLTKIEFGIFALSLTNYSKINRTAQQVIKFRKKYESYKSLGEKEKFRERFIAKYLANFNNPEKNTKEYTDNIIRYMRITKYIYIRGKYDNTCIDLEPRRMIEINSILAHDNGSARKFSQEEWVKYFGTFGSYKLPFDTIPKLQEILHALLEDINSLETKLQIQKTTVIIPNNKAALKTEIQKLRAKRIKLQNLEIKFDYNNNVSLIAEAIEALRNIRNSELKPSIALEKWINVGLNIINDSLLIKPNSIVGDDNEPTFTAPAGVPDIECYYKDFNATCEVTMLTSRDQWFNEGQPVMRHLREFENAHSDKECYCLFIAPSLHQDTINTYYTSVKYEYEGNRQKIVPLTIKQFIEILEIVAILKKTNKNFTHVYIKKLYDEIVAAVSMANSAVWISEKIPKILEAWEKAMLNLVA